ncbi:unnamed protein product [Strongylus vulgaris]|uniref:Uncharacterized protein n=1 Tax=Strongylus vulgaris TaxID=40348 RepID=A0A3P7LM83_STRVU|nr:unnamed protein product [Strongylus vulgaris]
MLMVYWRNSFSCFDIIFSPCSTWILEGATFHQLSEVSALLETAGIRKNKKTSKPKKALKYPQCLHLLECLQCPNFREALTSGILG